MTTCQRCGKTTDQPFHTCMATITPEAIAKKWTKHYEYWRGSQGFALEDVMTKAITEYAQEMEKRISDLEKINEAKDAQERIWIKVANEARERLAELERDKVRLGKFIFDTIIGEPCEDFEPDCPACQAVVLLKELKLDSAIQSTNEQKKD